jgi:hypothetical protein
MSNQVNVATQNEAILGKALALGGAAATATSDPEMASN